MIKLIGKITRMFNFPGTIRLVRFLFNPDYKNLPSYTINYDKNLKIKLDLNNWIDFAIFFQGYYEKEGVEFVKKNLKPNDVFIDVGANNGCYSLIASKIAKKVIAIEPNSISVERLKENIQLNGIRNIEVIECAVSNKKEVMPFYISRGKADKGGGSLRKLEDNPNSISVEVNTLNNLLNDEESVDFIKIDAEGKEDEVMEGASEIIEKFKPIIFKETRAGKKEVFNYDNI